MQEVGNNPLLASSLMMALRRVIPLFPAHKTRELNNWGKVRQKVEKKGKIWAVAKPSRGFIPPPRGDFVVQIDVGGGG